MDKPLWREVCAYTNETSPRLDEVLALNVLLISADQWRADCLGCTAGLPVRTPLTPGPPRGVPALLPRLDPPVRHPPGEWPGGVTRWVNIADARDVVALEKRLARVFGDRVEDIPVQNGATMHDVKPYLTSRQAGEVLA